MSQIRCPNCGGYKVESEFSIGPVLVGLGIGGLMTYSGLGEPHVGLLLFGILLLVYGLQALVYGLTRVKCRICGYRWNPRQQ
jgi:hypothetical protein